MKRRMAAHAAAQSYARIGLQPWLASVLVHGLVLGLAYSLVSRLEPLPETPPFTWDVTLANSTAPSQPVPEPADVSPFPSSAQEAKPPPASPSATAPVRERTYANAAAMPEVAPSAEIPGPTNPAVSRVVPDREVPIPATKPDEPLHATVEHRLAEAAERPVFQTPASEEPVNQPQEAASPVDPSRVGHQPAPDPEPARAIQRGASWEDERIAPDERPPTTGEATVPQEPEGTIPPSDPAPSQASRPAATDPAAEQPQQVAKASPARPPAPRADHRWLAEALWRKVAQLKRYPAAARLNGWEGKVVVRAVIGADGRLIEAKVQKSSGHEALDAAALEAVRQACPLEMQQVLDRSEVAFNLPIVYSLSN